MHSFLVVILLRDTKISFELYVLKMVEVKRIIRSLTKF